MNFQIAKRVRDRCLAEVASMVDAGDKTRWSVLEIYTGRQPESADAAIRVAEFWGHTLLARLTSSTPAFGTPVNGTISARPLAGSLALASGKATWARVYDRDGSTIMDLDIAERGAAMNFDDTQIHEGQMILIEGFVVNLPLG